MSSVFILMALARKKHIADTTTITRFTLPNDVNETLFVICVLIICALILCFMFVLCNYAVSIFCWRSMLKEKMLGEIPYTSIPPRRFTESIEMRIKWRIDTLNEQPKFFLSPLWIAKFTLKKDIEVSLVELQSKFNNLNQH